MHDFLCLHDFLYCLPVVPTRVFIELTVRSHPFSLVTHTMSYLQSTPYLPIRRLTGEHKEPITYLAFSSTSNYLASASEDGVLVIWNILNGAQVSSVRFDSPVLSLVWDSRRQTRLFIGCVDGTAVYIDNYQVTLPLQMRGILSNAFTGTSHTHIRRPNPYASLRICYQLSSIAMRPCSSEWP